MSGLSLTVMICHAPDLAAFMGLEAPPWGWRRRPVLAALKSPLALRFAPRMGVNDAGFPDRRSTSVGCHEAVIFLRHLVQREG